MPRVNSIILSASLAAIATVGCGCGVSAQGQRGVDPNMGHFYMARQQITILDDGPVVNNRVSAPAQPGQPAPGNGALPGGPMPLAPARWQQYSPAETPPNLSTSLPRVNNGIPKKIPLPVANHGSPRSLDVGNRAKPVAAAPPRPTGPATYEPYKKFAVEPPASTAAGSSSQGQVYGDVLHWARRKHN